MLGIFWGTAAKKIMQRRSNPSMHLNVSAHRIRTGRLWKIIYPDNAPRSRLNRLNSFFSQYLGNLARTAGYSLLLYCSLRVFFLPNVPNRCRITLRPGSLRKSCLATRWPSLDGVWRYCYCHIKHVENPDRAFRRTVLSLQVKYLALSLSGRENKRGLRCRG